MSEPGQSSEGNSDPSLSNVGVTRIDAPSFRGSYLSNGGTTGPPGTATGPPVPPRPDFGMQNNTMNPGYLGGLGATPYGMGGYGGMGGYSSYLGGGLGTSYGMGGYGGLGGYGNMGGYGMGIGGMGMSPYGRIGGPMYGDIESRFIQMAEESSRPAFDSIQGLVSAVGSVAMMLENTFFALTSSFRAILGVAENFGRLRSLFAQFWSTFAVFRTLNWLIRKLMVLLGIRTENEFKAWAEAVQATQTGTATAAQQARGSSWPVLLFFGVIAAAPYIVLRMMNGLTRSIHEKLNDPKTWQNPLRAVAQYDYQAASPHEISFSASQVLTVAPKELHGQLWNSGWLMASTDGQRAGIIPTNYVKIIKPVESSVVDG